MLEDEEHPGSYVWGIYGNPEPTVSLKGCLITTVLQTDTPFARVAGIERGVAGTVVRVFNVGSTVEYT